MRDKRGFTLIEILLVVVIIGALAAMVVPRLTGRSEQAKVTIARVDIESNIASALKLYELDNGTFPTTSQGLSALLMKPTTSPQPSNWNGPYLEKEPYDPWGRRYEYAYPGTHGTSYDLYSKGSKPEDESSWVTNWKRAEQK
ncbi:MAG: Type II secretion system protein G [Candidatus Omnitrophica bacterium]|nr:Type II secretion system protein G [Candidatus Omnitrophota bacterium]